MSAALVPVKHLSGSKTRLAALWPRDALGSLCLAMLGDLLEALAGARRVDRTAVVTPDPRVAEAARAAGATAFELTDPGLNPSIERGAERLALAPDEPLLVVLGDVAAARSEDFDRMFETLDDLGGRGAVLAGSDDGGTSALLRAPADVFAPRFGRDSAARHAEAAAAAGVPCVALRLASLRIDVDSPDDLARLIDGPGPSGLGPARRTRALVAERESAGAAGRSTP
ncbi:MAG: 2-phospho-L-lactate guanylyltransferase [Myxococcota bacterium]